MSKVKLCGLKRQLDIEAVNLLMPDYVGFVFANKSKRYVSKDEAKRLRDILKESIVSVGVFKDNPLEEVIDILKSGAVSVAQLHGKEDEEFIKQVKESCGCKVIKAFGISGEMDVKKANESKADYVLLDTPGGGTGQLFDHELLSDMEREYFLAGGLSSENAVDIIKEYTPYCVDVSSNIETDGVKDPAKMKKFVDTVRQATNRM